MIPEVSVTPLRLALLTEEDGRSSTSLESQQKIPTSKTPGNLVLLYIPVVGTLFDRQLLLEQKLARTNFI